MGLLSVDAASGCHQHLGAFFCVSLQLVVALPGGSHLWGDGAKLASLGVACCCLSFGNPATSREASGFASPPRGGFALSRVSVSLST